VKAEALSIVKPFVQQILDGSKTLEIRSWAPPRLPLLDLLLVENGCRLSASMPEDPAGLIRVIVDVVGVHEWSATEAEAAGAQWSPGYLSWELANVREVTPAIPCVARRKIFRVEMDGTLPAFQRRPGRIRP
jgi:hypothetical protein